MGPIVGLVDFAEPYLELKTIDCFSDACSDFQAAISSQLWLFVALKEHHLEWT